jgi:hypothetical protein
MNFDIIGKIDGNFLIYKNNRNRYAISVYDNSMNLKDQIDLKFLPDKTLNIDFVAYPDFAWLIYQFQKEMCFIAMPSKLTAMES